jgi:hypothetical protein
MDPSVILIGAIVVIVVIFFATARPPSFGGRESRMPRGLDLFAPELSSI